jgi:Cd2+/Zn2+-exporting ATPase
MLTPSTGMLTRAQAICVTCVQGGQRFVGRYRAFLLAPGTLFTLTSFVLLVAAVINNPSGLSELSHASSPLYLAAALVGSVYIWWSAAQGIRRRDFTADIPVSIATIAAIAIGQFSAAAVVAVLLLAGGMLEEFVSARAGNALDRLAKLLPNEVLVRRDGQDVLIPLEQVRNADLVLIRSGERIPADGLILSGAAAVNQAAITGESLPVDKQAGDTVYAGTLSEVGALEIRATRVGDETTLGQIRRMVAEAQEQKAPIERILNRFAQFYTPAAILLGLAVWLWSGDMLRAITILIVFCPCVMVLATPTALVASIGNAALRGSLVKKGATVEALARINTVVFDKTGTLTTGQPQLTAITPLDHRAEADLLHLAAVAEKFSEHPLGKAVVQSAQGRGMAIPDPESFTTLPGLGVRAMIDGQDVVIGRPRLLAEEGVAISADVTEQSERLAAVGRTVILVAQAQQVIGMLTLEDALRPEAKDVIARLTKLGVYTVLTSGDNTATAKRIATELAIDDVHAEALPQQKAALVKQLQAAGRRVAFVGDGVNDGPALATADVGVAMGLGGTDVAIETAEIALLTDDLSRLPHLFGLARQAMRAIVQNLVFSLGVLVIAVTLATLGILSPVTGALLHELSSIPVIANSARLIGLRDRTE